jgi:hypothetical protein
MEHHGAWVASVHEKHRIRLEGEPLAAIRWLNATSPADGFASIGAWRQVQISAEPLYGTAIEKSLAARLAKSPLSAKKSVGSVIELLRFMAVTWAIKFSAEPSRQRLSFVIPKPLRDLEVLPVVGQPVVIFVSGNIVEIWGRENWLDYIAQVRRRLDQLVDDASDPSEE